MKTRPRLTKYERVYRSDYQQISVYGAILWACQWGFYMNALVFLSYYFDHPINDLLYQILKKIWL